MIYHRLAEEREKHLVRTTGLLWGKAARIVAGGGDACVKAYLGGLPAGARGYAFETKTVPTYFRRFFGREGAVWAAGSPGVLDVVDQPDYVAIEVNVLESPVL